MSSTGTTPTLKSGGTSKLPLIGLILGALIFVGFSIASFVTMAKFIGTQDNWNAVQPQISKVIGFSIAGMIGFTIASLIYFMQDPNKSIIFNIVVSCLALTMAFIAVAIAAITKSS
jgi:hypothetical protein